ncbi:DUF4326 domain-containing protein [Nocardiopsis sp. NPDC006139]|uniref:DUF4326 domain-containing protein n=1 Tax=Nocardiopsis sp. NPDC006139 TaxID=3154578 RepID=UPI0033AC0560
MGRGAAARCDAGGAAGHLRRRGGVVKPSRIQFRHAKGWCAPEGAVYVGRGTKWGSPYRVRIDFKGDSRTYRVIDAQGRTVKAGMPRALDAIRMCSDTWLADLRTIPHDSEVAARVRAELAGRDLMCPCSAERECHADVLLDLANGGAS